MKIIIYLFKHGRQREPSVKTIRSLSNFRDAASCYQELGNENNLLLRLRIEFTTVHFIFRRCVAAPVVLIKNQIYANMNSTKPDFVSVIAAYRYLIKRYSEWYIKSRTNVTDIVCYMK